MEGWIYMASFGTLHCNGQDVGYEMLLPVF